MRIISLLMLGGILLTSCIPVEKLKYTIEESDTRYEYTNIRSQKTIQPDDYLYIKIYSLDETTTAIFEDGRSFNQDEQLISYNVNEKGLISFPFVGDIYVKDLTIDEAKIMLEKELNRYLTNISVRIRFVGNKVTVIGEVGRPGSYTFYDEKITIFQAISLAGDMSDYGNKEKVTLIRERDNVVKYEYLDLTKKNIAESEYYYLLPNDLLIIDPVRAKYRSLQDRSLIPLILSSVTSILSIYTTITLINNQNNSSSN